MISAPNVRQGPNKAARVARTNVLRPPGIVRRWWGLGVAVSDMNIDLTMNFYHSLAQFIAKVKNKLLNHA